MIEILKAALKVAELEAKNVELRTQLEEVDNKCRELNESIPWDYQQHTHPLWKTYCDHIGKSLEASEVRDKLKKRLKNNEKKINELKPLISTHSPEVRDNLRYLLNRAIF
ncbi:MAG: hypothetical protein ACRDD8_05820 [Bacteroidales bacterium]